MAKRKPKLKTQRHPRYIWRPVVELTWEVIRLNESGSVGGHSRHSSE
jgi:hypothetical protein